MPSKRRGPAGRVLLDPESVLSGRVKPTAEELLDLIHRVNPTDRELGAPEAELRYAQKSRLQSLLVRRFQADIEVVPDPDHEGTVSLRHRGHERDGCHAMIAALDEDARAWVQLQLDLSPRPPEAPAAPAARPSRRGAEAPAAPAARPSRRGAEAPAAGDDALDATPEALVRRAEEAILASDYERARRDLDRALSVSGGAPGPAAALLALLVDTLGDDAEALALEAKLPVATREAPDVRGRLALAAARSGEEDRALALVRGARDEQVGAVFVALASVALTRGVAARAAEHLEQAKRCDPAHPALAGLAAEIARARAAARGPAEEEIQALVEAGREDEAARKAGEVLARWPDSAVARRTLRDFEERRQRDEVERLAAEADTALAEGDTAAALARLGKAIFLARGREREALERRTRDIEAAERERRAAESVARVESLLGVPDPTEGLLAYLEIDEALRGRVSARAGALEALRWIELTARRAPSARVSAVLALGRARERVTAEPEEALALLTPHLGVLERVPEARQLAQQAEARLAERRAERALAEVEAAHAALHAGEAAEALRRLSDVALRDLPEAARVEVEALRVRAAREVLEARRHVGMCPLEGLLHLLEPQPIEASPDLLAPERPEPKEKEERSLSQLVDAVNTADAYLSRGDAKGALAALDHALYRNTKQEQVYARLAEAWMHVEPRDPMEQFRKIAALAKFLEAHGEERPPLGKDLPIPGATWERARLDEIAGRARQWLDVQGSSSNSPLEHHPWVGAAHGCSSGQDPTSE